MGNRKTFKDFISKVDINNDDYLIGYDQPIPGGEKKFKLSDLRNYVKSSDVIELEKSQILPIFDPNDPFVSNNDLEKSSIPYLSGKIFHVTGGDHILLELPKLTEDFDENINLICMVVNLTDNRRVEMKTINGSKSLNARGVNHYDTQTSDPTTVTFLKKKYDTAIFYYNKGEWYGYGDLDGPASLNIKNVYTDYVFTLADEDKILHFKDATENDSDGMRIILPKPADMKSGTQFFVHNISSKWIEFSVPDGVSFHARAKFLRRKYDDAVLYTDGIDWFATGDLS